MANTTLLIDFDSTIIQTESMDALVEIALKDHPEKVAIAEKIVDLTHRGMAGDMSFADTLNQRLALFQANRTMVQQAAHTLRDAISPSFLRHKAWIHAYADHIYIVSSGFIELISPVAAWLGIAEDRIIANRFIYDANEQIIGADKNCPLSGNQGKVAAIKALQLTGRSIMLGDGYTDYEPRQYGAVDAFYAYTENVRRANVIAVADGICPDFDTFLQLSGLSQ